jgi:pyridoxal phosphate enzyme (YggS family)
LNVGKNLETVRQNIERAGGNPHDITIVAVTKGFGVDVCREAIGAGLTILGENRVMEALAKKPRVEGATWHLIGHLQTNKVKISFQQFALIQSLDSLHLAEAIAHRDHAQRVLVEVNVAREAQKTGIAPDAAIALIREASELLDVRGVMGMGPAQRDPASAFDELKRIRDEAQQRLGRALPILSMGMSGDYVAAVKAGSTMLRLGTALFGQRPG